MHMPPIDLLIICCAIGLVALLYASVGHGGASGYIAVMALASIPATTIKPTALLLNILVSSVALYHFSRAGHFSWRTFWPFAITSIPCSFLGGMTSLPPHLLKPLLGVVLLISAWRLLLKQKHDETAASPPSIPAAMAIGAVLGILSGLTGVGGGIFLSPLLLLLGWAKTKDTAGISALFILLNSSAGLLGHLASLGNIPAYAPLLAFTAVVGGACGAYLGSRHFPLSAIRYLLTAVLLIAGIKLITF
jgi:uncharacterized membrane protein YfcA